MQGHIREIASRDDNLNVRAHEALHDILHFGFFGLVLYCNKSSAFFIKTVVPLASVVEASKPQAYTTILTESLSFLTTTVLLTVTNPLFPTNPERSFDSFTDAPRNLSARTASTVFW